MQLVGVVEDGIDDETGVWVDALVHNVGCVLDQLLTNSLLFDFCRVSVVPILAWFAD